MSGSESSSQELANFIGITVKSLGHSSLGTFLHRWENVIFSLIAAVFLSVIAYFAQRGRALIPERRLQNAVEVLVESVSNFVSGVLGEKEGRHYLPYIGTLFLYILTMNFMGMVPGMKSPYFQPQHYRGPGLLHLYLCAIHRHAQAGDGGVS